MVLTVGLQYSMYGEQVDLSHEKSLPCFENIDLVGESKEKRIQRIRGEKRLTRIEKSTNGENKMKPTFKIQLYEMRNF